MFSLGTSSARRPSKRQRTAHIARCNFEINHLIQRQEEQDQVQEQQLPLEEQHLPNEIIDKIVEDLFIVVFLFYCCL